MFKNLLFIALIALAAAKHSHRQGPDAGTDACISTNCSAQAKACFANEGCIQTMDSCNDPTNMGSPTKAETACLKKNDSAWGLVQCIVSHCAPPSFSHKQSHVMKKWSQRHAQ